MRAKYNHIGSRNQQRGSFESNIILSTNNRRHRRAAWSGDQKDAMLWEEKTTVILAWREARGR